jgi:hypothetical protein
MLTNSPWHKVCQTLTLAHVKCVVTGVDHCIFKGWELSQRYFHSKKVNVFVMGGDSRVLSRTVCCHRIGSGVSSWVSMILLF